MAIPKGHKANFETLQRACENGDLALMECVDKNTGAPVITICAVSCEGEEGEFVFTPLARMFDGNPYEQLVPPMQEAA